MALAFDAASSFNETTVDGTSTWNHTCSGSDRCLIVGVSHFSGAPRTISSVTYNGVAMTSLGKNDGNSGVASVELFKLVAPATGSNAILVTFSAAALMIGGGVSFTGADQTTPTGSAVSANDGGGTASPATVNVSSAADEIVVDTVIVTDGAAAVTVTVGGGQDQRWNLTESAAVMGGGSTEVGSATTTMSWTWTGAQAWSIIAVAVKPASAIPTGEPVPQPNEVLGLPRNEGRVDDGWVEELTQVANWWGGGELDIQGWFDPDLIVPAVGAAAKTLPADAGSYVISGQVATLERGFKVAAASGSYIVSGQTATLKRGYKVAATVGSYTVAGQTADLRVARRISAAAGAYAIAGQTANLLFGRLISAAVGAYNIAGQDATLTYAAAIKSIVAEAGSYLIAGQDAVLRIGRMLTAASGAYTIAGQVANLLIQRRLVCDAGAYLVAGQDATLTFTGSGPATPFDNITRNIFDRIMHPIKLDIDDPFDEKDQPA